MLGIDAQHHAWPEDFTCVAGGSGCSTQAAYLSFLLSALTKLHAPQPDPSTTTLCFPVPVVLWLSRTTGTPAGLPFPLAVPCKRDVSMVSQALGFLSSRLPLEEDARSGQ